MRSLGRIATLSLTALISAPLFSSLALAQECPVRSASVQAGLEKILATTSESELADMRIQQMTASLEKKIGTLRSDSMQSGYQIYHLDILIKDNRREIQVVRDNMEEASALASEIATNLLKSGLREAYETPTKALTCQPWRVSEIWLQFECRQKNELAASTALKNAAWISTNKQLAKACLSRWAAEDVTEQNRIDEEVRQAQREERRQAELQAIEIARLNHERAEREEAKRAHHAQELLRMRTKTTAEIVASENQLAGLQAAELQYERCKNNWRHFDKNSISDDSIEKVRQSGVMLYSTPADPKREYCSHLVAASKEEIQIMKSYVAGDEELLRIAYNQALGTEAEGREIYQLSQVAVIQMRLQQCRSEIARCESGESATSGGRLLQSVKAKVREYRAKNKAHRPAHSGNVSGSL